MMSKNGFLFISLLMFLAAIYMFYMYMSSHTSHYLALSLLSLLVGVMDFVAYLRKTDRDRDRRR